MQPQRLGGAIEQMFAVGMQRREAAVARNAVARAPPGNEVERQRIAQEFENPQVRTKPIGTSIGESPFDDCTILAART